MAVVIINALGERVGTPAAAAMQGGIPGTAGNVMGDPSQAFPSMAGPAASGIAVTPVQDPAVQTALSLETALAAGTWQSVRDRAAEAAVLAGASLTGGPASNLGLGGGASALKIGWGWGSWRDVGRDGPTEVVRIPTIDGGFRKVVVPRRNRRPRVEMWLSPSPVTSARRVDVPETASLSTLAESIAQMDLSAEMLVPLIKKFAAQQVLRMKRRIESQRAEEEAAQIEMLLVMKAALKIKLAALNPQDPNFDPTQRRLAAVESALTQVASAPN